MIQDSHDTPRNLHADLKPDWGRLYAPRWRPCEWRLRDLVMGSAALTAIMALIPPIGMTIMVGLARDTLNPDDDPSSFGVLWCGASVVGCLGTAVAVAIVFRLLPAAASFRLILPFCLGVVLLSLWGWTGDPPGFESLETVVLDARVCYRFAVLAIPAALAGWGVAEYSG